MFSIIRLLLNATSTFGLFILRIDNFVFNLMEHLTQAVTLLPHRITKTSQFCYTFIYFS